MSERLTTYNAASGTSAYALARMWGDPPWPNRLLNQSEAEVLGLEARTVTDDLEELAVMAALHARLTGWLPLQIHSALLAGATVQQVADAVGQPTSRAIEMWRDWSRRQDAVWGGQVGAELPRQAERYRVEHDQVTAIIAAYEQPAAGS